MRRLVPAWLLGLLIVFPASAARLAPSEFYEHVRAAERADEAGDHAAAAAVYEILARDRHEDPQWQWRFAFSLYRAGEFDRALAPGVEALDAGWGQENAVAYSVAQGFAQAGRAEEALDWTERALKARWHDRPRLKTDPAFEGLRENPRFRELAGFPPEGDYDREARWSHDLDFFLEEVRRLHASPERLALRPELEREVERLRSRVGVLDDEQIAVALQRLVAGLGDGHSYVALGHGGGMHFPALPLSLFWFADGPHVIAAGTEHEDLLGARLLAIEDRPVDGVFDDLRPYVGRDNDQGLPWRGPAYLRNLRILEEIGFVEAVGPVTLTVQDRRGVERTVTVEPVAGRVPVDLGDVEAPVEDPPLWLRDTESNYWLEALPELGAVYVQFNRVQPEEDEAIDAFARRVRGEIERRGASNLVIDVRHNGGGNNFLHWPLVRLVGWHETESEWNRTFVITGRNTFSACQNFVNFLDRGTSAIFVGEPSSSSPNFVGESTSAELPFSSLRMGISSRYWQDSFPEDRRPWISPEIPVDLTAADWFEGRDPVMDALKEILPR